MDGKAAKDCLEPTTFRERWLRGLRDKSPFWDGPRVVEELKRRGGLDFVRGEQKNSRTNHFFDQLIAEMRVYRQEAEANDQGLIGLKQDFADLDTMLQGWEKKAEKQKSRVRLPDLEYLLSRIHENIRDERAALATLKKQAEQKRHYGLGPYEVLYPNHPSPKYVHPKLGRDRRLQIQLAKNFLITLRLQEGFTLEMIARLVVLAHWAGGLAKPDPRGEFLLLENGRRLTPRKVRDNLRTAGLQRARFEEQKTRKSDPRAERRA